MKREEHVHDSGDRAIEQEENTGVWGCVGDRGGKAGSGVRTCRLQSGSCIGLQRHLGATQARQMTTHSSVLAWRIPGTGEPGGLPSLGSHRVGHD